MVTLSATTFFFLTASLVFAVFYGVIPQFYHRREEWKQFRFIFTLKDGDLLLSEGDFIKLLIVENHKNDFFVKAKIRTMDSNRWDEVTLDYGTVSGIARRTKMRKV